MSTPLLVSRTYNLNQGKINWYSALRHFESFKSVARADFYNMTSSAGDWEGYILQKLGYTYHLILFSQNNNYPHYGYTISTFEKDIAQYWGYLPGEDEILTEIEEYIKMFA